LKIPYFEVSAKTSKNITELFFELTRVAAKAKKAAAGKFQQQMGGADSDDEDIQQPDDQKQGWSSWFFDKCCLV